MSRKNNYRARHDDWSYYDEADDELPRSKRRRSSSGYRNSRLRYRTQSSVFRVLLGLTVLIVGTIIALPYSNVAPRRLATEDEIETAEPPRQAPELPLQIPAQESPIATKSPESDLLDNDDMGLVSNAASLEGVSAPPEMPGHYAPPHRSLDKKHDKTRSKSAKHPAIVDTDDYSTKDYSTKDYSTKDYAAKDPTKDYAAKDPKADRQTTDRSTEVRSKATSTTDDKTTLDKQNVTSKSLKTIHAPPRHRIRDGDTLVSLAEHYYNDASRATEIFRANREQLTDPDLLPVGSWLLIPQLVPQREEWSSVPGEHFN